MQFSSKSLLQEYYAKQHKPSPVYLTSSIGRDWVSTVTLADGISFCGRVAPRKKEAEDSAAELALQRLPVERKKEPKIALVVSSENSNWAIESFRNHPGVDLFVTILADECEVPKPASNLTVVVCRSKDDELKAAASFLKQVSYKRYSQILPLIHCRASIGALTFIDGEYAIHKSTVVNTSERLLI